jgi:hypothetical protein
MLAVTSEATGIQLTPPMVFVADVALVLVILSVLILLFGHLRQSRQDYFATVRSLVGSGAMPRLPPLSQGFGALVGGGLIVAALGVLAGTRLLDAKHVEVILGVLTGYLCGVGVRQRER